MSTDLDLRLQPTLRLSLDTSSSLPEREISDESSDLSCRTPKGTENRVPALLTCPPAPTKRWRPATEAAWCKRRRRRLEFFETVAGEEIDSFFKSSFELVAKRRCIRPCL